MTITITHVRVWVCVSERARAHRLLPRCKILPFLFEEIKPTIRLNSLLILFLCASFSPTFISFSRWLVQRTPPSPRALRIGAQAHSWRGRVSTLSPARRRSRALQQELRCRRRGPSERAAREWESSHEGAADDDDGSARSSARCISLHAAFTLVLLCFPDWRLLRYFRGWVLPSFSLSRSKTSPLHYQFNYFG